MGPRGAGERETCPEGPEGATTAATARAAAEAAATAAAAPGWAARARARGARDFFRRVEDYLESPSISHDSNLK